MGLVPQTPPADKNQPAAATTTRALLHKLRSTLCGLRLGLKLTVVGGALATYSLLLFYVASKLDGPLARFHYLLALLVVFAALICCVVIGHGHRLRTFRDRIMMMVRQDSDDIATLRADLRAERERNDKLEGRLKNVEGHLEVRELVKEMWRGNGLATNALGDLLRNQDNWEN